MVHFAHSPRPAPQDLFKIMQVLDNFGGKIPILSKFSAQALPGVKTPLAPLTKILDPRLEKAFDRQML